MLRFPNSCVLYLSGFVLSFITSPALKTESIEPIKAEFMISKAFPYDTSGNDNGLFCFT